jgi:predicted NAD/FAD-binding protein
MYKVALMQRKRIAVVGGGISGLSAAWLLSRRYEVVLYEKNDYIGGHSNTVEVEGPSGPVAIDTGFVVYNERNYPHLTRLFQTLGVATQPTDMSFSASIDGGRVEYAGDNLDTLFAQRRNLLNPGFLGMLRDVLRFNRDAKRSLASGDADHLSLGEYLERGRYGQHLVDHYLLPMGAAIWSCPTTTMRAFPAKSFLRFFHNHGLIELQNRPQWHTVVGGSRNYVRRMVEALGEGVKRACGVSAVQRKEDGVWVIGRDGQRERFDEVVFGSHADETLAMIEQPSSEERRILGAFSYQENRTLLHSDTALMPQNHKVWSSWNYLACGGRTGTDSVSVTYWMNRLHRLPDGHRPYLVSLNPLSEPDARHVITEISYHHPVFDDAAMKAQSLLPAIQGRDRLWFCGAYSGFGFHEDGLRSAVDVALRLGVFAPWQVGEQHEAPSPLPAAARTGVVLP